MRKLLVLSLVLGGCGGGVKKAPTTSTTTSTTTSAERKGMPWIEDDLTRAIALGKATGKPVFLDTWAPWCHACLSMQAYVLADPALAPLSDRFVWAAVDTEKEANAAALVPYPVEGWPTFFLIDPADGSVAGRWVGTMSIKQLRTFLEEGERTVQLLRLGQLAPGDPLAILRAADRASLDQQHTEAAKLYARARAAAPADWPRRPEALSGQVRALRKSADHTACVDLAFAELDSTGNASNAADIAIDGLGCADQLAKTDPRVPRYRRAAHDRLLALAQDASAPLSADDRGDVWRYVWEVREQLGDAEGARQAARSRLAVLDAAAAAAPDAEAASTYDGARLETLLYLERGPDAVRMLSESEKRLPRDYNPPARLARAHLAQGQLEPALAAIDRALAMAYGPRKGGLLALKADILEKLGRRDQARAVVEEQIALFRSLQGPQQRPAQEAAARKRLEGLR